MNSRPPQPVLDPKFWEQRIAEHPGFIRSAMFHCTDEVWEGHRKRHVAELAAVIKPTDSVLDAGCGYGRLLELLPPNWCGLYLGVDLSPDFVKVASKSYPSRAFCVADLRYPSLTRVVNQFDWCVGISLERMVVVNCGEYVWEQILTNIKAISRKQLFLNFDNSE